MVTPPSSLPCPSSSSAHHHQSFSTLSQIQPNNPPVRAPSAASHMSAASGRESKSGSHLSNGSVPGEGYSPPSDPSPGYVDPMSGHSQHTTQPYPGGPFGHSNPSTMLPQVTASPPPQAPPYIPPPQHAMAPDPIHSMAMNMMMNPPGPGGMMGPPGMPWQHGPGQWRPGPSNYPGQPPYPRPHMPNGHAPGIQRQLPPDPLEAYAPTRTSLPLTGMPNGMQVQTAAMLQQAILAANGSGRPLSAHGEGRERRRERERSHKDDERADGERESGRDEPEVITTIFVVGFPDDMGEREFQNIFTFSSGFEAATLKFPSSSVRREPAAALLAELSQIAANHTAAGEHGEMPPVGLEEALAASQMGGTANTSSSTTPSAAMSLTPSAPSGPTFGNPAALPQLPTRRQTIGFARFKTRAAAIAAKEHLQGRKIDSLIGATLKAEMAKKNLHTKRTTSGEELVGLLLRSGRLAGLMNAAGQQNLAASIGSGQGSLQGMMPLSAGPAPQPPSAREAWDSWPVQGGEREKAIEESRPMMPPNYPNPSFPYPTSYPPQQSTMATSAQSDASTSPPLSVKSPNGRPTDSKALLALAEEADEMEGWSVGGAVGMGMGLDGFHTHQRERERSSGSGTQPLAISNMQQGGINSYGRNDPVNYGISPPGGSDHMSDAGRSLGGAANPADQNPPINTLYVGNLPAISPPTHPPNFLEESLRALFSRCQGFKRMSFRQKINGPMCFVEYEDVPFASQAIKDLYGHNLGGLVKGGIRLSYSKNSLGQRGSSHPTGINSSILGGIAHTVALAGMSSPSTSNSVPGPGYGLQFQPGSGPNSQSAPISVRRSGDGMSLSPTAQPFNATLPTATSPRSRYFGSSPPNSSKDPQGGYNSYPPNSQPPSVVGPGPGGNGGQFSPVSSPIRTPASYSWVSSGGSSGYGFDPFAGHGMSLGGAASAWGQGGQGGNGGGNGSGGPQ